MNEIWRQIEDFPNYQVSSFGQIRSNYLRGSRSKYSFEYKILKYSINKAGYKSVHLYKEKKRKTIMLHRLVAQAFLKKDQERIFVNHIDGNKLNNNIENLEFCTQSENMKHAVSTGLTPPPPKNRKLSDSAVMDIYRQSNLNNNAELAKKYGIDKSCISRIKNGKSYEWLTFHATN